MSELRSLSLDVGRRQSLAMKAFVWLLTLGLAIVSTSCWVISHLVVVSLRATHRGMAVPNLTDWVLLPHWWMLWCPLPWVILAVYLSTRTSLSTSSALLFAGTVVVGGALLVACVATACILPYTMIVDF